LHSILVPSIIFIIDHASSFIITHNTGLDRDVYFSLPPQLREEVLLGEVTERRRRASFDETIALAVSAVSSAPVAPVPPVNPPLDFQSVFASVALGFAQSTQLPDPSLSVAATPVSDVPAVVASSPAAPDSEGNENARFLASLPFDLRQDVLLSADAAFLQSLPLLAQAEARQMRSQGRASSMLSGLVAREGSQLLRDRSISEFSDMIDQVRMGDGVGFPGSVIAARRRDRETAFGILESRGRGAPEEAVPPPGMTAVATTLFLTDDRPARGKDLPFGASLVTSLFGCMLGVNKVRGPRPLLRLLATTCRYRACRPWVLRALVSVLTRNPELFVHSMNCILEAEGRVTDPSDSIHADIQMLSRRIGATIPAGSAGLTTTSVKMRRFLSLLSYAMKKTDNLVWFDLLVRPEFCAYRIVGSSSVRVTDLDRQEENNKKGEKWLFGSILGLLKDPATLNSSPTLDTTLHVIEIMCEPLSHMSVSEANILASYQTTNRWPKKAVVIEAEASAPKCENGHLMQISGYAEDGYQGGFHCDNCVEHRMQGDRWLCLICSSDICFECFPAPTVPLSPSTDASALSSSSSNSGNNEPAPGAEVVTSIDAPTEQEGQRSKKARRTSASARRSTLTAPSTSTSSSSSSSSSSSATAEQTLALIPPPAPAVASSGSGSAKPRSIEAEEQGVDIPFPILGEEECMILAEISGSEACGGGMGKRLMRILRPLALYDGNWTKILNCLSVVGGGLAVQALEEVTVVRSILSQVVAERGNAQAAMSLPQLTTPRSVSELRLLQVLRLMTVLRSNKQNSKGAMAAAAASVGAVTDLAGSVLGSRSPAGTPSGKQDSHCVILSRLQFYSILI
jgi:Zinc finger, ZZ type/Ubiquitin binding region